MSSGLTEGCWFFFFFFFSFMYCINFGCAVSLLLYMAFSSCSEQGLLSSCSAWASQCCGFPCCEAHVLGTCVSVVAALGLWSLGSVVVAHRLRYPAPYGIFLDRGLNLCPLHWQVNSLPLDHQGKIQVVNSLPLFSL